MYSRHVEKPFLFPKNCLFLESQFLIAPVQHFPLFDLDFFPVFGRWRWKVLFEPLGEFFGRNGPSRDNAQFSKLWIQVGADFFAREDAQELRERLPRRLPEEITKGDVERGIAAIDVRQEIHDDYVRKVDTEHEAMIWTHPGMTTYYRNKSGRVFSAMPWRFVDYWAMTHDADLNRYHLTKA